jgi:hypothetical protein
MKKLFTRIIIHCVLPLVAGFLIYYYFRPGVEIIQWFAMRRPVADPVDMNRVQQLLIYSGPDFLWSYSLASALFIWQAAQVSTPRLFPLFVLLLLLAAELAQGWLLPGFTFDWPDLGAAVLAFFLSFYLTHQRHEKK